MPEALTKGQKKLITEIDEMIDSLGIDYKNTILVKKKDRTAYIESVKDQYVRGQVVFSYVLIDEFLGSIVCNYFFGKKRSFIKLWRTKKFRNFNHYILEKLSLFEKLELVKITFDLPPAIESKIRAINDLRNGLAHSFFPQNLRRNQSIYKGTSIYSTEGFKLFINDKDEINRFFMKKLYNVKI